jgi:phosphoesterase RecJ-like protein
MPLDWSPFVTFVRRHQRFLLTTHVRPDGDGLGSMLALGEALERLGKAVQLTIASNMPRRYAFLDPDHRIARFTPPGDAWRDADAILVLDTGTWNQLDDFGPFLRASPAARVVIDHHLTQDDLGAVRFVDTTAEATGRLAYEAIRALGQPVSESQAAALFVAVAMDTGWFRHSNTTAATHDLAAELIRAGAPDATLHQHLFEQNTLPQLKLTGLVLDRARVTDGGQIAYSEIHRGDYPATGAEPSDSEDLVNYLRGLAGVEVGLLFMEQLRGGIKVSFRSRARVDVSRVAQRFGGGGHSRAAGARLDDPLADARAAVLQAVRDALAAAS